MFSNCGAEEEDIPDRDHIWRGAQDDGSFVYDYDDEAWRMSSETAASRNLQIEVDKSRDWDPKQRELSAFWREHIEARHARATEADCATEKWPVMFEARVDVIRSIEYQVRHTPEPDGFPFCGHTSVLVPPDTEKERRERMKMRLAGEFRHCYGSISQEIPGPP